MTLQSFCIPRSNIVLSLICTGNATHKHPSTQDQGNHLAEECLSSDEGTPPSMKKNIHVREKVQYLEQEVQEFVGKKTDKAR